MRPKIPSTHGFGLIQTTVSQIVLAQSEMGQGVYTALPMIVAEEADLDWSRVRIVQSDLSRDTGGSGSVINNYMPLRRAGATVRALMIAAGAKSWSVPEAECTTANGEVSHAASGKKAETGGGGGTGGGADPPGGDHRADPLSLEEAVQGAGNGVGRSCFGISRVNSTIAKGC
jgi:hypothetical protein